MSCFYARYYMIRRRTHQGDGIAVLPSNLGLADGLLNLGLEERGISRSLGSAVQS